MIKTTLAAVAISFVALSSLAGVASAASSNSDCAYARTNYMQVGDTGVHNIFLRAVEACAARGQ